MMTLSPGSTVGCTARMENNPRTVSPLAQGLWEAFLGSCFSAQGSRHFPSLLPGRLGWDINMEGRLSITVQTPVEQL